MIMPFDDLNTDKFLKFGDYYGMVIEIFPMSFGLLAEDRQNMVINCFSTAKCLLFSAAKLLCFFGWRTTL
jgi:hypothetical protein